MRYIYFLIIGLFICRSSFSQITQYQHKPCILGNELIKVKTNDTLTISHKHLYIHDIDTSDYTDYKIHIIPQKGYTIIDDNNIIVTEKDKNNIQIKLYINDGIYSSEPYYMDVEIKNNKKNIVFFVSNSGNDSNDGTKEQPLKTINEVQKRIRRISHKNKSIIVYLRDGEYNLNKPIIFNKEDSGNKDCSITFTAYQNENVKISGSKKLNFTDFSDIDEVVANKIRNKSYIDRIKKIDLRKYGINEYGTIGHVGFLVNRSTIPPLSLYVDGKAMHLARYPNIGNFNDIEYTTTERNKFKSRSNIVLNWITNNDVWIDGALSKPWEWKKNKIKSISDSGIVTTEWDYISDIEKNTAKMFYFNILEELDFPEEYYIDRESGLLYAYLPEGCNSDNDIRLSSLTEPLIILKDVNNIVLKNIKLDGSRNIAITGQNINNVTFDNIEISSCGLGGINIYGRKNKIINSYIHDIGGSGIFINGGNEITLEAGGNIIENCLIKNTSQEIRVYTPGISINGIGQIIRHTEISHCPHMAIDIKGNNHIIEYSNIHHAPTEYSDMLSVYLNTGESILNRGTIIRWNRFHDVIGNWKMGAGVYIDNDTNGVIVEENIFYNSFACNEGWSVMVHGGADNVVKNNLFYNCSFPYMISLRLNGYAKNDFLSRLKIWETSFQQDYAKNYLDMYPELKEYLFDDNTKFTPKNNSYSIKLSSDSITVLNYWNRRTPSTNVFSGNLIYNDFEVPLMMPSTDYKKNIENREYYVTGEFKMINNEREDNLIHYNNHMINYNPGFSSVKEKDFKILRNSKNTYITNKLPWLLNARFNDAGRQEDINNKLK